MILNIFNRNKELIDTHVLSGVRDDELKDRLDVLLRLVPYGLTFNDNDANPVANLNLDMDGPAAEYTARNAVTEIYSIFQLEVPVELDVIAKLDSKYDNHLTAEVIDDRAVRIITPYGSLAVPRSAHDFRRLSNINNLLGDFLTDIEPLFDTVVTKRGCTETVLHTTDAFGEDAPLDIQYKETVTETADEKCGLIFLVKDKRNQEAMIALERLSGTVSPETLRDIGVFQVILEKLKNGLNVKKLSPVNPHYPNCLQFDQPLSSIEKKIQYAIGKALESAGYMNFEPKFVTGANKKELLDNPNYIPL